MKAVPVYDCFLLCFFTMLVIIYMKKGALLKNLSCLVLSENSIYILINVTAFTHFSQMFVLCQCCHEEFL